MAKIFWINKGPARIDGKKYFYGDAIPVEKVDKKTFESWKNDGLVSEVPTAKELTQEESKDKKTIKELKASTKAAETLLVEANERIVELEKELEEATKPAEKAATGDGK